MKIPVDKTETIPSQINETANTLTTFAETVATDIRAARAFSLSSGEMVDDSYKDPIKVIQVPRIKETTVQNNLAPDGSTKLAIPGVSVINARL